VQLVARHEPQKRSFAGTHRAIACRRVRGAAMKRRIFRSERQKYVKI
jgi:hypothetical protein